MAIWALRRISSRSTPSSGRSVSGTEFSRTSHRPQAPMARVGTTIDAGSIQLDEGKAGLHRRPPEDAWHRPPRRSEARRFACRPSMRIEPAPASGSRAPKQNAATAVPACSFSSSSTAASACEPESARLASAVDHIGAGHAARPSSAITTRISRRPPSSRLEPSAATPCPTSLRQIAEISSGDGRSLPPPAPNAPRETRAGNPEASRRYRRSEARSHP